MEQGSIAARRCRLIGRQSFFNFNPLWIQRSVA
jgi:hypothetical protein